MQINDKKNQALVDFIGQTGQTDDLELLWLNGETGEFTVSDGWYKYLVDQGFSGNVNDMQFQWLGDQGYTGSLNDRFLSFWTDGIPSGVLIQDVFSVDLWAGNSANRDIVTGIDATTSDVMLWSKRRNSSGYNNNVYDTLRGVQTVLWTDSTVGNTTRVQGLLAFNDDGFNCGTDVLMNQTGGTYVGWSFKKAPKFLDIIKYTGDGNAGREIPHALGVQAGLVFVKELNNAANWIIQHISRGGTKFLNLDTSGAEQTSISPWNNVTMTDTEVTFGNSNSVNQLNDEYIMYVFAHDPSDSGVIQCGEYDGNAPSSPTVVLGWKPQYVQIKSATDASDWEIHDSTRTVIKRLKPNTSGAEDDHGSVTFTETGFTIQGNLSPNINGTTYIYMAIREETL